MGRRRGCPGLLTATQASALMLSSNHALHTLHTLHSLHELLPSRCMRSRACSCSYTALRRDGSHLVHGEQERASIGLEHGLVELRPRGVRGANGHHTQAEDEPGGSVDNRSDDNAKVLKLARQVGAEPLESARDVGEVACRTADVREAPANATRPRSWLEMKRVHQLRRRWGYTLTALPQTPRH